MDTILHAMAYDLPVKEFSRHLSTLLQESAVDKTLNLAGRRVVLIDHFTIHHGLQGAVPPCLGLFSDMF
jgi:hypothetical protein